MVGRAATDWPTERTAKTETSADVEKSMATAVMRLALKIALDGVMTKSKQQVERTTVTGLR